MSNYDVIVEEFDVVDFLSDSCDSWLEADWFTML